jgi:hypothetical protein
LQALQTIVHNKMQQMDFEPGAAEDQAWCEMDLRQNSMLLSVTKELPRFEPKGVKKKDLDPKRKVFPRDRWFKPFPAYDEGSSAENRKRKGFPRPDKVATPRQQFSLPAGDGKVIIAKSILPVFLFLQTRAATGVTLAALNHRRIINI